MESKTYQYIFIGIREAYLRFRDGSTLGVSLVHWAGEFCC